MEEIINTLRQLDEKSVQDGVSSHYIEIRQNEYETVLGGNKEGLVWLALQALKLASSIEGAHLHLDEAGMADSAETNLVITNVKSPYS